MFCLPKTAWPPTSGFDGGHEAVQCMPRSSHLVNPLEIDSRQRRPLRSRGLTPAGLCSGSASGRLAQARAESFSRHRSVSGHLAPG